MSILFRRYIDCTAPQQYYLCAANGFNGCCSVDPCSLPDCPDVSDPCTTSMTAAATEVVSALSPAAAISGNTSPAPSNAQLVTALPTPIAQQTLSEYSSSSQSQSTADATPLQPTTPLTQASVNGILPSAVGIIPTSGGVIVVEPTSNGRTPAQTSIFMATSSQASSSTATISRLSSATMAHTITSVSIKPATASSLATDHNSSTNSKGPVVGGAIGGVAVVATVLLVILLCCRRRKRVKRERKQEQTVVDQRYVVTLDTRSR